MTPAEKSPPRLRQRLVKHALRFLLISAVLLGPNLWFFAKWSWPRTAIPPVGVAEIDQRSAPGLPPALASSLSAALVERRVLAGLPSLSAAVAFDGRWQWAAASGWADIEQSQPARVNSRYRTGSIAKPITALAMMRLVETRQLDLDAPLSKTLPTLPAHLHPITLRQLASHRAGIRHYQLLPPWWMGWHEAFSTQPYASVEDGLTIFIDDALRYPPGSDFLYSTFGYSLLSRWLEVAGGQDFPSLLQAQVFDPLTMTDTLVDRSGPMPGRVAFYSAEAGRYTPAYPIDSSNKIAGGGLVSTPTDLTRLGLALLDDSLLSETSRTAMFTPQALSDGRMNPENYALGWRVDTSVRLLGEDRPIQIIHHGGTQAGAAAFLMMLPEHGVVVAVMSNSGRAAARAEVQEAAYVLARLVIPPARSAAQE